MKLIIATLALVFSSQMTIAANTIQNLAPRLQSIMVNGLHSHLTVQSSLPHEMIHEYLANRYGDAQADQYIFVDDPGQYPLNEFKTGHVNTYMTNLEIRKNLRRLGVHRNTIRNAEAVNWTMDQLGAFFAYEGMARNGCGEPTPFLLVLDTKEKMVWGVDLNPCKK